MCEKQFSIFINQKQGEKNIYKNYCEWENLFQKTKREIDFCNFFCFPFRLEIKYVSREKERDGRRRGREREKCIAWIDKNCGQRTKNCGKRRVTHRGREREKRERKCAF